MKEQIIIFFTALMFYTRIPCPKNIDHSPEYLNKATRYFSLIGIIVGLISFIIFITFNYLLGSTLAVTLAILAGVLTTGAFHEDGLADVFDGFGGGWNKLQILTIMKDSRVGAYGGIALVFLFLIKFIALVQITALSLTSLLYDQAYLIIGLVFVTYHSLARFSASNIIFFSTYSREDETSKVKPIAKSHTKKEVFGVYFFGLLPLFFFSIIQPQILLVLIPLVLLIYYSKKYFEKWIDGYTGDCLGAVEQLAECIILLSIISIWKFFG